MDPVLTLAPPLHSTATCEEILTYCAHVVEALWARLSQEHSTDAQPVTVVLLRVLRRIHELHPGILGMTHTLPPPPPRSSPHPRPTTPGGIGLDRTHASDPATTVATVATVDRLVLLVTMLCHFRNRAVASHAASLRSLLMSPCDRF